MTLASPQICNHEFDDPIDGLVGDVYDCAAEPSRWPQVLGQVCDVVGCSAAAVVVAALDGSETRLLFKHGVGVEALAGFRPEFAFDAARNSRDVHGQEEADLDGPLVLSCIMPRAAVEKVRVYREWSTPKGFADTISAVLHVTQKRIVTANFFRTAPSDRRDDESITMLRTLVPHLRRATKLTDLLDKYRVRTRAAGVVLDRLANAVVIVDADARILDANALARRMLEAQRPIKAEGGRISAQGSEAGRLLAKAICAAGRNAAGRQTTDVAAVSVVAGGDVQLIHVLALGSEGAEPSSLRNEAAAIVITSSARQATPDIGPLASALGLTPAQSNVLAVVAEGHGAAVAADRLGISVATARTHMKRIFAKLGVKSHAELVALVGRMTL